MDYDVALKSKVISNITLKLRRGISKFTVPGPSTPAPYCFTLNKDFWSES